MKPVDFKQSNAVYAKDQEEYLNLPVHKENVKKFRNEELWQEACDRESEHKEKIREFADSIE